MSESIEQGHDAYAFEANLAIRMSRLMSGNRDSGSISKKQSLQMSEIDADGKGNCLETKQQQQPATAPAIASAVASPVSALLSRPTLFAAAARVIKEKEKKSDIEASISGRSAMRTRLQLALRHPPQLKAVLRGLNHLFYRANAASRAGHDGLIDGAGRGGRNFNVTIYVFQHFEGNLSSLLLTNERGILGIRRADC